MSCPEPLTLSIYVDGELEADERRRAELHLVACRSCRAEVVALQQEGVALTNVLNERSPAPLRVRAVSSPARDLAFGLPAAVAAVTVVLTIAGLLMELRLPGVLDLFNPRRLVGAYEMLFDSVFMLRSWLPALFDLAASIGAVAAVSALGCAGVHALSRRLPRSSLLVIGLIWVCLNVPGSASALDFRHDEETDIGRGETVDETLVCTGDRVSIDGTVDGDLIVGAERFTLRGRVTGSLYVFGSEVEIDGRVDGSIIVVGERVRLGGEVGEAVLLGGKRLTISEGAKLGRDVTLLGEGARLEGSAPRDVSFAGEWIEVRGEIARDLHVLRAQRVALLDGARVGRDVRAHLWGRDTVDQAPGASVAGEVRVERESMVRDHYLARYRDPGFYGMLLVAAGAAFVFGLGLYLLDPRLFEADPPDARAFFRSLGMGALVLIAGPLAVVLLGLTVIGIPLAVLVGFVLISAVYTAYVLAAGIVGQALRTPASPGLGAFAPSFLLGVLILSIAAALPLVGPALRIVAVLFGLGCLVERVRGLRALNLSGFLRD